MAIHVFVDQDTRTFNDTRADDEERGFHVVFFEFLKQNPEMQSE